MKTSSRRRVLISSVAMLLVAMLALGTATFAWFTQSTQATADQLSVKTVKSSELKLSKTTGDWTDQLHYAYTGKILKPASSADGLTWFAATAADKTDYAADTSTITDISDSLDGYVFAEQLNVQNAGKATVENVKITFALTETEQVSGAGYVRIALVPADKRGADATHTAANFKAGVFAAGTDTADALTSTTGTAVTVDAADGTSGSVTVGTLTSGAAKYYNLFVWFEGQDTDCKDANAGNEMPEITFTVTGDTAEQTA